MHLRDQTCTIHPPHNIPDQTVIYTDGTCDNPRDPYAARAAWAAIIRTPTDPPHDAAATNWNFQVLAAGHCPGHQTIGRAELYAMVVAVELVSADASASHIQFVTDSKYVVNCINQIEDETIFTSPHKKAHWDLIRRLILTWQPAKFTVVKIKSHQDIIQAQTEQQAWYIRGNALADQTAMHIRQIDDTDFANICTTVQQHLQQQQKILSKVYMYLIDIAHARMAKIDLTKQKKNLHDSLGPLSGEAVDVFQNQIQKLQSWQVREAAYVMPAIPHRVVF